MHFRFCEGSHLPVIGHANATQAQRLFNVTHQGAASDRGRSLMYARMPCRVFGQVGMQQLSEKMPHIIRRAEVSQSLSRVCLSQELRSRHGFRQWTHAMYLDKIGALASAIENNPVNRSGAMGWNVFDVSVPLPSTWCCCWRFAAASRLAPWVRPSAARVKTKTSVSAGKPCLFCPSLAETPRSQELRLKTRSRNRAYTYTPTQRRR